MDYKEKLQELLESASDISGAALMGTDGIPVEIINRHPEINMELLGAEYAVVYKDFQRAAQDFQSGLIQMIIVKNTKGTVILGALNQDYFIAVQISRGALGGKVSSLLRQILSQLRLEF